jgi:histone RNA hairpin-binding protein
MEKVISGRKTKRIYKLTYSHRVPLIETDIRKLEQRQKQLNYGMETEGYLNYIRSVHPKRIWKETPNIYQLCSKKSWDEQVRRWRRYLHEYDPSGRIDNTDGDTSE